MALKPLHKLIEAHVLAAERLHGDDTPVPVLAKGKIETGRAWVYVRDDAPFGGPDPPAALFRYSPRPFKRSPGRAFAGTRNSASSNASGNGSERNFS